MQVFGLPGQVISNAGAASRLLAAKTPDIAAARRRDAVARWRGAMARGLTAAAAAEAVGVARATLYRWEKRPEPRSRRPRRVRPRSWTPRLVAAVEDLRADNPVWGKRKLGPILRQAGHAVSDTTVGRILAHLVRLGRAAPAPVFRRPTRAAAQGRRRWAQRLRGALKADRPGGAVQVDTLSLSFPGGKGVKQFTAVDRLSRWTVAMAAWRATAASAARFTGKLVAELPFPLAAIQIDGGSEFMAEFETACEKKRITLHVLPPRSPERGGRVERPAGRLALRVLRRLRPAAPHRRTQPAHRRLCSPLQHLPAPRRPWTDHPQGVSRITASRGDPTVSNVLNPDSWLTDIAGSGKMRFHSPKGWLAVIPKPLVDVSNSPTWRPMIRSRLIPSRVEALKNLSR